MGLRDKYKKNQSQHQNLVKFRGVIRYIIYPHGFIEADEMLWVSMQVEDPLTKRKIQVSGETNHHSVGDYLEFYGEWEEYKKKQVFKLKYALKVDDDIVGATSMLAYLFGPSSAQKVINGYEGNPIEAMSQFKNNIDNFRNDMKQVKGIGNKKIDNAIEKHKKSVSIEHLYYKFCRFNLSLNKAMKLVKLWGSKANEIMDENVYQLIYIDGFGFQTIDRIGLGYYKFDKEDVRRVEAYIIQLLKNKTSQGDCFMELEGEKGIIKQAQKGLNISDSLIRERIIELVSNNKIVQSIKKDKIIFYLPYIFKAEKNVAQMVSSAVRKNRIIKENKVDEMIEAYELRNGFQLAQKQKEGIKTSSINQFSIISGPPGSGKTTLIDCICDIFNQSKKNCQIRLAALSGKAATRMSEATGLEASTIHRLLGYNPETGWKYNENNPLPGIDLLIVDEFSMVDIVLFERLLKAISINTVVILVGDKDQLPSVDCGQVLEDLIAVPYIPKTVLNEIYRQADGSTTLQRALTYNSEIVPDLSDADDFKFIETPSTDLQKTKKIITNLYLQKVKEWGIENVSLLLPQKVGNIGSEIMNLSLQNILNPSDSSKQEIKVGYVHILREGDRIIQLKNFPEYNLYNGMVGTIIECIPSKNKNPSEDVLTVHFDNEVEHIYTREEFDTIALAYSLTVHKTQGSEYKCVIMLIDENHSFMLRKKLVYTGWTRNKNELFIVGQKKMIPYSLKNKDIPRNTKLTDMLLEYAV